MSNLIHEVQLPDDVDWGLKGGPEFKSYLNLAVSGKEQRNVCHEQAQMKYSFQHIVLDKTRRDILIAFAKARRGMKFGFRLHDPLDYQAINEPFVSALNPIGWTNPAGPWQMCKTYADAQGTYYRRIFKPVVGGTADATGYIPNPPIIYNGSTPMVAGTDYDIDFTTGLVTMLTGTAPTNWTGDFDVPVRFDEDSAKFLLFAFDNTDWPDITVVEIKMENQILDPTFRAGATPIIIPTAPDPVPTSSGLSGGSGSVDLLTANWLLMSSPNRTTSHLSGNLYEAAMLDTDAAYPAGFPTGVFFWIKNRAGHPWDIEKYDSSYIYHWITEDGDSVDQPACKAAGYSSCWIDPSAYKRFLTPVKILPRNYVLGTPQTLDTAGPNLFRRTTNCESSFSLIALGDVRAITSGPFNMSWGGTVGTAPTIQNDYYYGGTISSGIFKDKESTFYVQGYGRVAWKYYKLVNGVYQLQQASINQNVVSGGAPVPSFPCGTGMSWW